ncbi:MAG: hypothetical protein SFW09_02960 [Hyphomicrobiaceae bacterium]|nr:hypothetical protein [Hyphomicrobiaceae bacterium]
MSSSFEALLSGNYWSGIERTGAPVFVTYSFPATKEQVADHADVLGAVAYDTFQSFSATQKAAAVAALSQWADASGLTILEVAPGEGQINFALYDFTGTSFADAAGIALNPFGTWNYQSMLGPAAATYIDDRGDGVTEASGDVFLNLAALQSNPDYDVDLSSDASTALLLHEIGHAIGLKHTGSAPDGNVTFSGLAVHDLLLEGALDHTDNTVMSYNVAAGGPPTTLGTFDLEAVAHIYGSSTADGSQVSSYVWDGVNHILTQTGHDLGSGPAGGDDVIRGISVRDVVQAGSGNDRIFGLGGDDTLDGGTGNDSIWAGLGDDIQTGGAGADWFYASLFDGRGAQADAVTDFDPLEDVLDLTLFGPADDNDEVTNFNGPASWEVLSSFVLGDSGDDAVLTGIWNGTTQTITLAGVDVASLGPGNVVLNSFDARSIVGTGGADMILGSLSADALSGGGGADLVVGDAGNDSVDGGAAADTMVGGSGNDTYRVDDIADIVTELVGAGTDLVRATVSRVLGANTENLLLEGGASIHGTGNELDNSLIGNAGANVLDGREGADRMFGHAGNDTYVVDHSGDLVGEAAGNGSDTVRASITYTLGANVEKLLLLGSAPINGTGNGLDNVILGNARTNRIDGAAGSDNLTAGGGLDYVTGGLGNDLFIYNSIADSAAGVGDRILDFTAGDRIWLQTIDANTLLGGNQAFALDTDGSFSAGEIRQTQFGANLLLEMNVDGTAAADMSILLIGRSGPLATGDFML